MQHFWHLALVHNVPAPGPRHLRAARYDLEPHQLQPFDHARLAVTSCGRRAMLALQLSNDFSFFALEQPIPS